jgi:uncharacterized ion transporter superfamily protein YfcC
MPHPLALMGGCILVAGLLTHIVPAGRYERQENPATGREMVVPGTYTRIAPHPLGPLDIALAVPKGVIDAADVLAVVLLVGATFVVIDRTGALHVALAVMVRRLKGREALAIPIVSLGFAAMGAFENMQEEIIGLTPVLVLLSVRLGFSPLTAVAMSIGAAAVGSAFSPINPFQVAIAQQAAGVPLFSGSGFRIAVMAPALLVWIWGVHKWGRTPFIQEPGATSEAAGAVPGKSPPSPFFTAVIFGLVMAGFGTFIWGLVRYEWGFNELSAIFVIVTVAVGLAGGLGIDGTAEAYAQGFRDLAYAAMLIGFARAIFVVLNEGQIIDSIVHGMFTPLEGLPPAIAAIGMMGLQGAVHVPVPSVSGQAVLTLPILAPLSDLLGMSRQIAVLAYQYGAGLCELLTPTNGALMAILAAAHVRYDEWFRFAFRMWLMLMALGAAALLIAVAVGLA